MRTKRRGQLIFIPWVDLHLLRSKDYTAKRG